MCGGGGVIVQLDWLVGPCHVEKIDSLRSTAIDHHILFHILEHSLGWSRLL